LAKAVVILAEAEAIRRSQASAIESPGPGGRAVDLRHHRLRHLVQNARHFHAAAKVCHPGFERQRRAAFRHRLDIAADAERAAGTLQENGADLVVLRRPPRRLDQTPRHLGIERIAAIRTVHGDGEQPGIELLQDHFIVHELLPMLFVVCCLSSVVSRMAHHRHCERSEAIHSAAGKMDCFVAALLAMTACRHFFTSGQRDASSDWNASLPGTVPNSL
jgi:hypothetical protein